jgi:hypothetical protein
MLLTLCHHQVFSEAYILHQCLAKTDSCSCSIIEFFFSVLRGIVIWKKYCLPTSIISHFAVSAETWWSWSCRWCGTSPLNCRHQRVYCSSPGDIIMSKQNHGGIISTGENSWFVHQALWKSYQQSSSIESGEAGEENDFFFRTNYLFHTWKGFWTCKILRYETDGFASPPKEGVLRIFIALKIHRPRPGLSLRTLCPIARTLNDDWV